MSFITVKIEQMRPERKLIEVIDWFENGRTVAEMTDLIYSYVYSRMDEYRLQFPEATEIRWEFTDVGNGHYISVPTKPLDIITDRFTTGQLKNLADKALELEDWRMLERVAYQLRMIGGIPGNKSAEMEIPASKYGYAWMIEDDDDELIDTDLDV